MAVRLGLLSAAAVALATASLRGSLAAHQPMSGWSGFSGGGRQFRFHELRAWYDLVRQEIPETAGLATLALDDPGFRRAEDQFRVIVSWARAPVPVPRIGPEAPEELPDYILTFWGDPASRLREWGVEDEYHRIRLGVWHAELWRRRDLDDGP